MDNRRIDLSLTGHDDFRLAMTLAFKSQYKATGYRIHENHLVLYWVDSPESTPFPYAMELSDVIPFVWGWLQKTQPSSGRPDHDGDNEKGYRVFNEAWGHVFGDYRAFIAITPIWAMYGK